MSDAVREGDWILIPTFIMGRPTGETTRLKVERFRFCLGVFENGAAREMGRFTPLCALYGRGPDSEQRYMPNRGEYLTHLVPVWRKEADGE